MPTYCMRPFFLASILLLFAIFTQATTISSVSGSTVTLTAGRMDGVQVGMTALVQGITNIGGKATEVAIAKVQVTAVNDRSCTASILEQSADATMPKISAGQKVVFKQALVPPSGKPAGELGSAEPPIPPPPPKDPYAGFSPLELSAKADAAYLAERYDWAEKLYSAVLRAVPDDQLASKRLKEISARKQQAEAEALRRAEVAEKLKNADFFLTRGDEAYRAGDYVLAASYYIKVSEVDESYRDAGAKYWLSRALAAKAKGDTATLRGARGQLKRMAVPESLNGDLAGLGPMPGEARTNSKDGLTYNYIPPGVFQMGCVPGGSSCSNDEIPRHTVTINKSFWMGKTEVTVDVYKRFCSATGRAMPSPPLFNPGWQSEDYPIVNVSWDDANAFCKWAGGRLPTEAEWEYAARAGTETATGLPETHAWSVENSGGHAHPVGQKTANVWELNDMSGNVWEWCSDWYESSYYAGSPEADPAGPSVGQYRVLRGGSCLGYRGGLRISVRNWLTPDNRAADNGFRCLRDAAP